MFPKIIKIVVSQNGWFIMENLIKMDDLGVPLFLETPIYLVSGTNISIYAIGSMGLVYIPTFTIKINHSCRSFDHTWILWVYIHLNLYFRVQLA